MPSTRPRALVALALAGGLLLAACSNSTSGGSAAAPAAAPGQADQLSAQAGGAEAAAPGAAAAAGSAVQAGKAAAGSTAGSSTTTRVGAAASATKLIRNAQVSFEVKDLVVAAAQVRQAAADLGGSVSSETTGYQADAKPIAEGSAPATGPTATAGQSLIVVRVPVASLDDAISRLTGPPGGKSGIGTLLTRSASSQDVTGDVADTTSRVATAKASVERVRALLQKASGLQDVVLLESELTRRESDLEALESRLASLNDRADLATLTVLLQTAEAAPPPPPGKQNAFLAGLQSGWDAVVASTTVVLTVLGALLPVAIVLAVVGWPLSLVLRRIRRNRPQPPRAETSRWPSGPLGPLGPGGPAGPADPGPLVPAGAPSGGSGTGTGSGTGSHPNQPVAP